MATPVLPGPGLVSGVVPADWPEGFAADIGWVAAGPVMVRLDVAERVVAELAYAARRERAAVPADLTSRLAVPSGMLPAVLNGLGVRLAPAVVLEAGQYGPPAPVMVLPPRRGRATAARAAAARATAAPRADNPFAALAALRR